MSRAAWTVAAFAAVLLLGVCYGRERAALAVAEERARVLTAALDSAHRATASASAAYRASLAAAAAVAARVAPAARRRAAAIAATDSALATGPDSAPPSPSAAADTTTALWVERLRSVVLQERAASDSVIGTLRATVALQSFALTAADSVIAAQRAELAASGAVVSALRRQARPSLLRRVGQTARWVAVGVALHAVAQTTRR